jgi:lipopolysaccharide export system permease protein
MTILDRYLARQLLASFFRIVFALIMLFILIDVLTHRADNIREYQIPVSTVALYYLTYVPTILFKYNAAGLGVLVAGILVLGRLAQQNELTAALAGGISVRRLVRVPVIIAALLALTAFAVQETAGVQATAKAAQIERQYFSKAAVSERAGVSWTNLEGGYTTHITKFNRRALTGEDVLIHRIAPNEELEIRAGRIFWDEARNQWMIEDGVWSSFNPSQQMERQARRITQVAAPFSEPPEELFALEQPADSKSTLAEDLRHAAAMGVPTHWQWVEYHLKFAQPALCFVMIWLAIPFALRMRRGGLAIGFGLSIGIGIAYILLFYVSLGMGYLQIFTPVAAAWSANIVFLVAGLFLSWRTPT